MPIGRASLLMITFAGDCLAHSTLKSLVLKLGYVDKCRAFQTVFSHLREHAAFL